MARSLNKLMLIGNVGGEPDIRTTSGGKKIASFSVATNRTFTDRNGQQQERTEWHRCTCWEKLADIVEQYVHKGDRLYLEGRVEYSQTEDDKGNVRYWTDVVVQNLIMLGGSGGEREQQPQQRVRRPAPAGKRAAPNPFDQDDDDLPF